MLFTRTARLQHGHVGTQSISDLQHNKRRTELHRLQAKHPELAARLEQQAAGDQGQAAEASTSSSSSDEVPTLAVYACRVSDLSCYRLHWRLCTPTGRWHTFLHRVQGGAGNGMLACQQSGMRASWRMRHGGRMMTFGFPFGSCCSDRLIPSCLTPQATATFFTAHSMRLHGTYTAVRLAGMHICQSLVCRMMVRCHRVRTRSGRQRC